MLRRTTFPRPLYVGAALLALAGCDARKEPASAPPRPQVGVVTVHPQAVPLRAELPGRTSAYRVSEVRPQVDGIVKARLFQEGGTVKAGQVLYQIDPASYQAAAEQARGTLASAEANLISLKSKADRYAQLVKVQGVSRQDYDDARAAYQQGLAAIITDKAALRTAQINLDRTQVKAAIAGRIGRSSVTEGALVTADQTTALATVQQLDPIYVDITQSSLELTRLKRQLASGGLTPAGARVTLKLEDGSDYGTAGTLQFSEVSVDESTGAVTLRAVMPNPQGLLLPGMYVRAEVEEGVMANAVLAPQRGVNRDQKGQPIAWVLTADNKVEERHLTTVQAIGDQWVVSAGLKDGDRLIVDGLQKVAVGQMVTPVPMDAAQPTTAKPAAAQPSNGK